MAVFYTNIDTTHVITDKRRIAQWISSTAEQEYFEVSDITIALCSDSYIVQENIKFLEHDYPTDIITFDYSSGKTIAGDLLISIDTVRSNAKIFGVTFRQELLRVIIHGVLHLCGYKDSTEDEQKLMRAKENIYLDQYFKAFK